MSEHLNSDLTCLSSTILQSFLGFLMFNVITYTLMVAQMVMVWATDYDEHREFYTHIFNGCYAALMFVVVVFFLIYGVEVFFKVRWEKSLNLRSNRASAKV